MSTELAIAAERGQSLAELMGVSINTESYPSIARLSLLQQPIMGEVEFNGKKIKTEVISVGAFTITQGENKAYSTTASIRIFAQRQQWQRWNDSTNEMEKTVQSTSINNDLKDSVGGFNLGRPSGYIEDFNALPESTKAIIRSVKRVTVYYGTVTLDNPVDEKGEPLDASNYKDIPFVMDVKNRDSLKNINAALNKLKKQSLLPIMANINLTSVEDVLPTGNKYATIEASVGQKLDIQDSDNDMLKDFLELIEYSNGKIIDLHNQRNDKSLTREDAAIVDDILNNDFIEVD